MKEIGRLSWRRVQEPIAEQFKVTQRMEQDVRLEAKRLKDPTKIIPLAEGHHLHDVDAHSDQHDVSDHHAATTGSRAFIFFAAVVAVVNAHERSTGKSCLNYVTLRISYVTGGRKCSNSDRWPARKLPLRHDLRW